MNMLRKKTREWLQKAERDEFEEILYKAKCTTLQTEVMHMRFIEDLEIYKIAQRLNRSETAVRAIITKAYDLIGKVLIRRRLILLQG